MPDDAEDDVEFVEQAEQRPDAPVAEEPVAEEPVIEVEIVEAEAVEEPVVQTPDEVPSSVADPVSDDTAGTDVVEGPR